VGIILPVKADAYPEALLLAAMPTEAVDSHHMKG